MGDKLKSLFGEPKKPVQPAPTPNAPAEEKPAVLQALPITDPKKKKAVDTGNFQTASGISL